MTDTAKIHDHFFNDCLAWVKQSFASELLNFDVHFDESAPHAHAVILSLIDDKMQGICLISVKGNLMRLINLFYSEIATRYVLAKASRKRLSAKDKHVYRTTSISA